MRLLIKNLTIIFYKKKFSLSIENIHGKYFTIDINNSPYNIKKKT